MKSNMKYTVVIPEHQEEENYKLTEANILETQENCSEIIRIKDTEGKGTSYSRHMGIDQAKTEIIITCDAHMRFAKNALDNMANHIASHDGDILCCLQCHYNETLSFDEALYTGAKLIWKQDEEKEKKTLSAVWDSNAVGEIPAVMGGCYGFTKTSYKKIGEPMKLGIGWGGDEESISIAMRLIGGTVELLEYRCAHQYFKTKKRIGNANQVWYNRLRILYYLPLDDVTTKELRDFTFQSNDLKDNTETQKMLDGKMAEILASRKVLESNQKVSFKDYAEKWLTGYKKDMPVKIETSDIPVRILEHECLNCTRKHLATVRELLYRKDDMIMVLGHLACAYNHSGIKAIDTLITNYKDLSPEDVLPILKNMDLKQPFEISTRSKASSEEQCVEYLAIAAVIAMEIQTGYNTEEYHAALLGNLSIAQDLSVLTNVELANRIRGIRLWLYPDGVRIAHLRDIDTALIKDMARLNFATMPNRLGPRRGTPCGGCKKSKVLPATAPV